MSQGQLEYVGPCTYTLIMWLGSQTAQVVTHSILADLELKVVKFHIMESVLLVARTR